MFRHCPLDRTLDSSNILKLLENPSPNAYNNKGESLHSPPDTKKQKKTLIHIAVKSFGKNS